MPDVLIEIDQNVIKHIMVTKILGVMLDCHLQRKEHVNCVNLKISKCIAIMYKLRDIFTVNTMKQLHNSLHLPYID